MKFSIALAICVFTLSFLFAAPLWAEADGAPPAASGVPGERTCSQTDCHRGNPVRENSQALELIMPDGFRYTPGVTQRIMVQVTDPGAQVFGFQATFRNSALEQAGTLAGVGGVTHVETEGSRQYVTHNTPRTDGRFPLDWTPPANAVGEITMFLAGNAANGDGENTGDQIHIRQFMLAQQAPPQGPKPSISTGGVVHGATFQAAQGLAPNTFGSIFGIELASGTAVWGDSFVNGRAPTELAGTKVLVNGKAAFVSFVSPSQVNFVVGSETAEGPVTVEVETATGRSAAATVQMNRTAPAFFAFDPKGRRYIAAVENEGRYLAAPADLFGGPLNRPMPAKVGDIIQIFGTGFGDTEPAVPIGQVPPAGVIARLKAPFKLLIGNVQAEVFFAGLSPFVGAYQAVFRVPALDPGEYPIKAEVDGKPTQDELFILVQRP